MRRRRLTTRSEVQLVRVEAILEYQREAFKAAELEKLA